MESALGHLTLTYSSIFAIASPYEIFPDGLFPINISYFSWTFAGSTEIQHVKWWIRIFSNEFVSEIFKKSYISKLYETYTNIKFLFQNKVGCIFPMVIIVRFPHGAVLRRRSSRRRTPQYFAPRWPFLFRSALQCKVQILSRNLFSLLTAG